MISQSRYINIISGVGAGQSVAQRQLILRLITQNALLPPGIVAEFSNSDSVGAYFGTASEEYYRALAYFKFVSKAIKSPQRMSFARWASVAIAPTIVGDALAKTLSQFQPLTAATLSLSVGGTTYPVGPINFTTATNLTQVAGLIQTAVQGAANAPAQLAGATVTFNSNTNQFVLTGATTGTGLITPIPTGLASDIAGILGWTTTGSVVVGGQAADTAVVAAQKSAAISNNFGSFAYTTPSVALANSDIAAIATWNDSQNNSYMYCVATPLSNLSALYALVKGYSGCALHVLSTSQSNDYVEQSPAEILAATDYTQPAANQNYMFYNFASRNTTVSDDTTANTVDALRGNYIGVTQSAGSPLAFFQRGVLCGGSTAAVDMNTYANEMWLKSAIFANLMSLLLNSPIVPADIDGQASIIAVIQSQVDVARANGVISKGKTLTVVQQQYIGQISGDANAWRQVQNIGFWLNVTFASTVNPNSGLTEWYASYQLIYSKGDAIRSVQGSDILI